MPRTLYLCRHAKSSWHDPSLNDFHRPLNERGERHAPIMAEYFAKRKEPVDLIVSSPALRALTTAHIMAKAIGIKEKDVQQDRGIYMGSTRGLLSLIKQLPDEANSVMFFGHNPGFTELADNLADKYIGNMPTGGIVRIDFEAGSWEEIGSGSGKVAWFDHPKKYPEMQ